MSLFRRINLSIRSLVHQVGLFDLKLVLKVHFKRMQMKMLFFFTGLFIWNPLKRAPTRSSLPALPSVQRRVPRFLRESRVRFRDGSHGSSLTASDTSALRSRLWYISWKKQVECFNSEQSSACKSDIISVRKWQLTLIRVKTLLSDVFSWHTDSRTHANTKNIFFHWI